jgi:hypothetical protein
MTRSFRPKPLFRKKQKPPAAFTMPKASSVRPSRPIAGAPLLPFTDATENEARMYFAKAALRDMRKKLKED